MLDLRYPGRRGFRIVSIRRLIWHGFRSALCSAIHNSGLAQDAVVNAVVSSAPTRLERNVVVIRTAEMFRCVPLKVTALFEGAPGYGSSSTVGEFGIVIIVQR
jgi:hypothetical protein